MSPCGEKMRHRLGRAADIVWIAGHDLFRDPGAVGECAREGAQEARPRVAGPHRESIARRWAVAQRTTGARKEEIRRNLASEGGRMGIAALNTRGNRVMGRQPQPEEHRGHAGADRRRPG